VKVFGEEIARSYDEWLMSPFGKYIDLREKRLIADLVLPRPGERLLDVGCGTGNHLLFFHEKGCHVTGIDSSEAMLKRAKDKMQGKGDLHVGHAEDLPFSDNEFDIVTLITSLEFLDHPAKGISEAIRVSRDRVFLGVLNRYSFIGAGRKLSALFTESVYSQARFYSFGAVEGMIRSCLGSVDIRWGSVCFLPGRCYSFGTEIEECIPVRRNPFGAFLGIAFSVVFNYRTVQDTIQDPFQLRTDSRRHIQSTVRGMKRQIDQNF